METRPISWMKLAGTALVVLVAMPALAGVIYQWDEFASNSETTGSIEFQDGVTVFDEAGDIASFSFVTHGNRSFDRRFAFEALGGVVLEDFLCSGSCLPPRKVAATLLKSHPSGAPVPQDPQSVFLSFHSTVKKKKPPGGGGFASTEMSWRVFSEPRSKGDAPLEQGSGRWVRVQVPEPPVILLFLAGLVGLSFARHSFRRGRRR